MRKHFKKIIAGIVLLLIICVVAGVALYKHFFDAGIVDMLSVSSDGQYVISTDEKEWAILWDLRTHTKKVLDKKSHIFSAYFIPNTDSFLWQSQNKIVHIENVNGQVIKEFKLPFYIYGIGMPKNSEYFMVGDIGDGQYYCHLTQCTMVSKPESNDPSIFLADQPHVYSIDNIDNRYILGSNLWGVYLWNLKTGKIVHHYIQNVAKTFATLSPNGKYVVSGDEGGGLFSWDLNTNCPFISYDDPYLGNNLAPPSPTAQPMGSDDERNLQRFYKKWHLLGVKPDENDIPKMPGDFKDKDGIYTNAVISVKFIDQTHYLRFTTRIPYAILYDVTNPKPLKYLPLGRDPMPSVSYYQRDEAIDTSPSAHILVTGKDSEGGILVYQYDPKTQTLKKIWDGE